MNRFRSLRVAAISSCAALLVGSIASAAVFQAYEVPPVLVEDDGQIFWVSAQRVIDEGPDLLRRLNDPLRFQVDWLLGALADPSTIRSGLPGRTDCVLILEPAAGAGRSSDFDRQVLLRDEILGGTVADSRAGLAWGSPHYMLLLNVDRWLKKPTDMEDDRSVYVSYPAGRVEIAGVPDHAPHPRVWSLRGAYQQLPRKHDAFRHRCRRPPGAHRMARR